MQEMDVFAEEFITTLKSQVFEIVEQIEKPWGVSIRIDDGQLNKFLELYYQNVDLPSFDAATSQSPKFLIVAPGKKLSWQVHERRTEIWKVIHGPVGVVRNEQDELPDTMDTFKEGEIITIGDQIRHRLVGLDQWGVIAEIWVHKDAQNISDEEDIRRIVDDFKRV